MKKLYSIVAILLLSVSGIFAQFPHAINFQAIARDANGDVMVSTPIQIRLTIIDGSATGTEVYQELRALTTNAYGSFSFQIGRDANYVTIGSFDAIDWNTGAKFLKIDYDPTNQFNWDLTLGTIEFVSVPFALSAENVSFIDASDAQDGDVLVYNSTTGMFEPGNVNATETDPIFNASPAKNITSTNITNWNTAYGWGNHSGLYRPISYVPAWSEITSNPFSITSPANNQLLKFNSTTSKWENWTPNFIQTLSLTDNILSLSNGGGSVTLPINSTNWLNYNDNVYINSTVGIGDLSLFSTALDVQNAGLIIVSKDVYSADLPLVVVGDVRNQTFGSDTYGRIIRISQINDITGGAGYDLGINQDENLFIKNKNDYSNAFILNGNGNIGINCDNPSSKLQVVGLPEYADNATALAAGLTVGAFYRTGDILKVVH